MEQLLDWGVRFPPLFLILTWQPFTAKAKLRSRCVAIAVEGKDEALILDLDWSTRQLSLKQALDMRVCFTTLFRTLTDLAPSVYASKTPATAVSPSLLMARTRTRHLSWSCIGGPRSCPSSRLWTWASASPPCS